MQLITVEELKSRLDAGENIHLVDVREDDERKEFNIGGIHHQIGLIRGMQVEPIEDLKEDEIIFYCRSGNRSGQACLILETMGYKNVKNLAGGMLEWKAKFGA